MIPEHGFIVLDNSCEMTEDVLFVSRVSSDRRVFFFLVYLRQVINKALGYEFPRQERDGATRRKGRNEALFPQKVPDRLGRRMPRPFFFNFFISEFNQ